MWGFFKAVNLNHLDVTVQTHGKSDYWHHFSVFVKFSRISIISVPAENYAS